MSHQDFMRGLSKADRRALTEKTNISGLVRFGVLVCLLVILSMAILSQPPFWPLLMLPQGLLIMSLFHLLHECIHDTPFQTQRLNTVVGTLCGFILLLPSEWFRYFHRDHHRYTQIEGKDPELDSSKPATKQQWLIHLSGLAVFISQLKVITKCASGAVKDSYIPSGARPLVIKQARITCTAYLMLFILSVAFGSTALLWIWILPLIIGQPFLRLYLLAEHTLCENTDDMLQNTRTVFTNPIIRWFTWNMPYHTEHHVFPGVPFHQLPELHNKITSYLQHTNTGYTEFNRQLYKTLK